MESGIRAFWKVAFPVIYLFSLGTATHYKDGQKVCLEILLNSY